MKIKTITCHDVYNAGASLQAYALIKYLQGQEHNVEIINYKPEYLDNHFRLFKINNPKYERNVFLKILYICAKFPSRVLNLKNKRKYKKFNKMFLNITNKKYISNEELKNNLPEADLYIAGSDQIWNSSFKNGRDPAFYLDFVPKNKKKISYAASFATETIDDKYKEDSKKMISRLDGIAVRELSGLSILKDLEINNGIQVLDPVFLLENEQWDEICIDINKKEKYIFVYDFDNSPLIENIAKDVAAKGNLKIYTVFNAKYSDKYIKNIGPQEFISYIKNADFVISNSFHATAFSIIFQKQFYVVNRKEKINTRMRDLLILLDIQNRLLDENYQKDSINNKINYKKIYDKQIFFTNKSKEYLNSFTRNMEVSI